MWRSSGCRNRVVATLNFNSASSTGLLSITRVEPDPLGLVWLVWSMVASSLGVKVYVLEVGPAGVVTERVFEAADSLLRTVVGRHVVAVGAARSLTVVST